ncbi:MAG: bifunctional helix-turn-helix transcriptional regulator/GNAT family N-acetyltransferase [bacterium]
MPDPKTVNAVRAFNRFYTRQIGLLDASYLQSGLTLIEARLIFELATSAARPGDLARDLGVDAGYLSRLIVRFERKGLVTRRKGLNDKRSWTICLSDAGRVLFDQLDKTSSRDIAAMLQPSQTAPLLAAMQAIRTQLDPAKAAATLRPLETGDLGWIAHRQSLLYAAEYGWDQGYEALISRILSEYHANFKPSRENAWIAEAHGTVVGSVFLVRETDDTARLRLLYVEPSVRGHGLGHRLVTECTDFARAAGYRDMVLWTQNNLTAARKIYAAQSWQLTKTEPHHSFGVDLVGETWRLAL